MEQLLISTRLAASYKQENLPGLNLVKRMRARGDYNTPGVNQIFD
jgi:hypothetical protein